MKKKILVLCLCVILATIAMVFGTMAYFADTASANTATVTVGSVRIKWADDTGENFFKPEESIKLMPGVSQTDTLVVENTGKNDAYIRIHIMFADSSIASLFDITFGDNGNAISLTEIEGTGSQSRGYTYLFPTKITGRTGKAAIETTITLKAGLDHADLQALQEGVTVMYLAEAIQTTTFDSPVDAFKDFYSYTAAETTTEAPTTETTTTN